VLSLEDVAKDLATFGLTVNQAKVYIALVRFRVASVAKIAQLSKVRREEIYRMLPKLEQLGLVERILGKPTKYRSIPLEEALSLLIKRQQEVISTKISKLTEKRAEILEQVKSLEAKRLVAEEETRFVLISDREQALRKIVSMMENAKREIAVAVSWDEFRYAYINYADTFKKAVGKGVKARALTEINEVDDLTMEILREAESLRDNVELRHADHLSSHIVIIDDKEVIVGTFIRPTMERHADLWTNDPAYINAMKTFFDRLWQESVDVQFRTDYLQTGRPVEQTEVVRGRDNIYERIFAGLSRTKSNLFVMGDGTSLNLVKRDFISTNMELKKRGVRIRFLTNINEGNLEVAEELSKQFEVRHMDPAPMRAILTDTEVGFSWLPLEQMPEAGIYSNNNEIVRMMWETAENAWKNAIDARARIDEIEKGTPIGRVSKPIVEHMLEKQKKRVR